MNIKTMTIFYGSDNLPYKDKERQVHYPISGSAFMGASSTTEIRFYIDQIGDYDTTWVSIAKLPNGKVGAKILEKAYDIELGESYVILPLTSFYTQAKGDLFINLNGYQGGVEVREDEETHIFDIVGTPTIQATGSVKIAINYATQFPVSEEEDITLQDIFAELGKKLNTTSPIYLRVIDTIANLNDSKYSSYISNGVVVFANAERKFYLVSGDGVYVGTEIKIDDDRYLLRDGTLPMLGNLNMNNKNINNAGPITGYSFTGQYTSTSEVRTQKIKSSSTQDIQVESNLNLTGKKIKNSAEPTSDYDLATKKYVDEHGGSGNVEFANIKGNATDNVSLKNELDNKASASDLETAITEQEKINQDLRGRIAGKGKNYAISWQQAKPTKEMVELGKALYRIDGTLIETWEDFVAYVEDVDSFSNAKFNSSEEIIDAYDTSKGLGYIVAVKDTAHYYAVRIFKNGELVDITPADNIVVFEQLPILDRWISPDGKGYALDTKADLSNYFTKGEVSAKVDPIIAKTTNISYTSSINETYITDKTRVDELIIDDSGDLETSPRIFATDEGDLVLQAKNGHQTKVKSTGELQTETLTDSEGNSVSVSELANRGILYELIYDGTNIKDKDTILTFEQIKALLQDEKNYVYVNDLVNHTMLNFGAYEEDALWFNSRYRISGENHLIRLIINSDNLIEYNDDVATNPNNSYTWSATQTFDNNVVIKEKIDFKYVDPYNRKTINIKNTGYFSLLDNSNYKLIYANGRDNLQIGDEHYKVQIPQLTAVNGKDLPAYPTLTTGDKPRALAIKDDNNLDFVEIGGGESNYYVINASDIASDDVLTPEQLDIVLNDKKPVLIAGTYKSRKNMVLLPNFEKTANRFGFCYWHDNYQNYICSWSVASNKINVSTGNIFQLGHSGGNVSSINGNFDIPKLRNLNSKAFPAYAQGYLYYNGSALSWKDEAEHIINVNATTNAGTYHCQFSLKAPSSTTFTTTGTIASYLYDKSSTLRLSASGTYVANGVKYLLTGISTQLNVEQKELVFEFINLTDGSDFTISSYGLEIVDTIM